MANFTLTPNMSLPSPTPGVDPGPDYADNQQTCLAILDAHTHALGSGVQITPAGLNINSSLTFNSNAATSLGYAGLSPQGAGVPVPVNDSLYASGVDLFYQDGNGNAVRITSGGAVNATSSGISSGTATASFVSSILVVDQSAGVGAPIDAATYILRYNGSYPSPSGNYILLSAPSSLSTGYQITFPATTPGASGAFLTANTSATLSYTNVDNSSLQISTSVLSVKAGGITDAMIQSGGLGTASIANQAITAAKIANNTITASQIASATITGTQVSSNVSLPGTAVQESGLNVIVSSTNATTSLKIIRGYVNSGPTIISGEGFTVSQPTTGVFTLTWSSGFADTPVVVACLAASIGEILIASPSTAGCTVQTYNSSGVAANFNFTFIATGQR